MTRRPCVFKNRLIQLSNRCYYVIFLTLRAAQKMRKGSVMSANIRRPTKIGYCNQENVWIIQTVSTMRKRRVNARKLNQIIVLLSFFFF